MQDTTIQDHSLDDAAPEAAPASFTLAGVRFGLLTMLPLTPGNFAYGMVFGVLAGNVGLSPREAVTMSGLVYSGAGQVAAMDLWAIPPPLLTIWLTTALVSLRYLVLGAALVAIAAHELMPGPWYVPLGAMAGVLAGPIMERVSGTAAPITGVPDAQ